MSTSQRSKGLGDTIAKITHKTGLAWFAEKAAKAIGMESCGCAERQQLLNELFPYKPAEMSDSEFQQVMREAVALNEQEDPDQHLRRLVRGPIARLATEASCRELWARLEGNAGPAVLLGSLSVELVADRVRTILVSPEVDGRILRGFARSRYPVTGVPKTPADALQSIQGKVGAIIIEGPEEPGWRPHLARGGILVTVQDGAFAVA